MPSIDIDGLRVAYEDAGTGVPIVFVPGITGTKDWFKYQFRGLRGSYRIISYDVRTAKNAATYTLDLLAEDLLRLLTALRLQSAAIAGHSFGAMIAQRFAALYPQRTDALVLISAFPNLPEISDETILEWMSPGNPPAESAFRVLMRQIFRLRAPEVPDDADAMEWLAAHSAKHLGATLPARINLVREFDSTEWISTVESPTLVVVGADDREPFLTGAQNLYESMVNVDLEVVEGGDQYCFYTRHDIVNDAIDDFLTELTPSL